MNEEETYECEVCGRECGENLLDFDWEYGWYCPDCEWLIEMREEKQEK